MAFNIELTGVVLCGGESSRMGMDKGLLQSNGRTWAQHAFDLLAGLNIPVFISINNRHYSDYTKLFEPTLLIEDNQELAIGGPLKGLLSVHQVLPKANLLVLAVDMPNMQPVVLQKLVETTYTINADAFVYSDSHGLEPLCGIYTAAGLQHIFKLAVEKKLPRFSMHYVVDQLATHMLPIEEGMKPFFTNCNTPEDLANLRS